MAIPHVDVRAQYAPLIGDLQEAFTRTLESGRFIFGPEVAAFEEECASLLGVQECVSCANGTDAPLRTAAAKTAPIVEHHLMMAGEIRGALR